DGLVASRCVRAPRRPPPQGGPRVVGRRSRARAEWERSRSSQRAAQRTRVRRGPRRVARLRLARGMGAGPAGRARRADARRSGLVLPSVARRSGRGVVGGAGRPERAHPRVRPRMGRTRATRRGAAPGRQSVTSTAMEPYAAAAVAYDLFYRHKDYRAEVSEVAAIVDARAPGARSVLDVGCGTG